MQLPASLRSDRIHIASELTIHIVGIRIRKLHRAGVSKAEIARRLEISRASVRRILADL